MLKSDEIEIEDNSFENDPVWIDVQAERQAAQLTNSFKKLKKTQKEITNKVNEVLFDTMQQVAANDSESDSDSEEYQKIQ